MSSPFNGWKGRKLFWIYPRKIKNGLSRLDRNPKIFVSLPLHQFFRKLSHNIIEFPRWHTNISPFHLVCFCNLHHPYFQVGRHDVYSVFFSGNHCVGKDGNSTSAFCNPLNLSQACLKKSFFYDEFHIYLLKKE